MREWVKVCWWWCFSFDWEQESEEGDRGRFYIITRQQLSKKKKIKKEKGPPQFVGIHLAPSIRWRHMVQRPHWVLTLSNRTAQQTSHDEGHFTAAVASLRLTLVFEFLLLLVCAAAAGRRIGVHRWSTQFLGFGFFHFLLDGLDVQLAFWGSWNGNEQVVRAGRYRFTRICFAQRWGAFFLPLADFFSRGFSLGGMKALFRSSCFLVNASACFAWEKGKMTHTRFGFQSGTLSFSY